ncbi:uncharacterized protein LOC106074245 [Biomphalaria glabrata]|uniref:Uncharacterized protein LOC106074245 n=1 Tax=Biomphalaria glabrata TaxID=6526 RepID=A0A9W3ACR0_BIOGL|nr:uncharacterized protein LOC106074245 [Biomphalaria glabrata]
MSSNKALVYYIVASLLIYHRVNSYNFFGNRSQYRCNCVNGCLEDGSCKYKNYGCQENYFGQSCQYVDVASMAKKNTVYTDRNYSTCYSNDIPIEFEYSYKVTFSFVQLIVMELALTSSYKHNEIVLHFKHDQTWITCKHQEIWEIDTKMTRIFCFDQTIVFDKVVISGPGLPYVCEVYISLGRNIGLKQFVKVKIDSGEDIVPANDGNIESCYKSKIQKPLQELTFYTPSWVYYINAFRTFNLRIYPFYGIDEYQMERFSVMMELLNGSTTNIADVTDTNSQVNIPLYISEIRSIKINNATINAVNYYNLNFCEVELYGDCKQSTYGLDCDKRCHCPEQRCDSDGYCYMCEEVNGINVCRKTCQQCASPCSPSGECIECKPGFKGLHCVQLCANCGGTFRCDRESGVCSKVGGCVTGFSGDLCDKTCGSCDGGACDRQTGACLHYKCQAKYRGLKCDQKCSHCSVDGSCDMLTGNCTFGCIHGYRGDVCLLECSNCAGDSSCDRFNASCNSGLCNPGFKGADCSDVCTNCAGKGECHIKTGACLSGCNPGFKGSHCSQTCEHCINGTCYPDNGTCTIGCLKGFYRHDCERTCAHCIDNNGCHNVTGQCFKGCENGYYSPTCNEVCGYCAGDKSCDRVTGKCSSGCKAGYTGDYCKETVIEETETESVVLFYVTFLIMIGIVFFFLFCSQKIFWYCSLTGRDSQDSKQKILKNSQMTTSSEFFSGDSREESFLEKYAFLK